ncbi:MAG: hypothetical protein ACKVS6_16220 [Planctomycetota bacterium]
MQLLRNESEKLTNEKREELISLLGKLDGTNDRELTIDNALLRYTESRLGVAYIKKSRGKKERKPEVDVNESPAETVLTEPAPESPIEVVPVAELATDNVTEVIEPAPEFDTIQDTPVKPTRNKKKPARKGGRR